MGPHILPGYQLKIPRKPDAGLCEHNFESAAALMVCGNLDDCPPN